MALLRCVHRLNFNFWLDGAEYIKGKQTIAIYHYSILKLYVLGFYGRLSQWRKLGGANTAFAPPYLKCGGAKVCFCTTRTSLKYIIINKQVQNSIFRACIRHNHLNYYPIWLYLYSKHGLRYILVLDSKIPYNRLR